MLLSTMYKTDKPLQKRAFLMGEHTLRKLDYLTMWLPLNDSAKEVCFQIAFRLLFMSSTTF